MQEFLASPLFKGIVAFVVIVFVVRFLLHKLFPPKPSAQQLRVRCAGCGWTGTVGKYMKKCSRCGSDSVQPIRR